MNSIRCPCEDLSGMDVARKLVCLAREIGHKTTLEDINVHNLVPNTLNVKNKLGVNLKNKLIEYIIHSKLLQQIHLK